MNVENSQFKVGSLDMLMSLNESSSKLDNTLDKTCKKFEKICFETGSNEIKYQDPMDESRIKDYKEYIQTFTWDSRKFNTKLPLVEICQGINKKMKDNEALIKTYVDEVNSIKNKLAGYSRKDTGNLQTRDFFDEIYTSEEL